MIDLLPIAISALVVAAFVLVVSRKFSISSRYERKPRNRSLWSSQDHGEDPTDEGSHERS